MLTSPLERDRAPINIFISVDLPAPFYPSNETISPRFNSTDTPLRAWTLLE